MWVDDVSACVVTCDVDEEKVSRWVISISRAKGSEWFGMVPATCNGNDVWKNNGCSLGSYCLNDEERTGENENKEGALADDPP